MALSSGAEVVWCVMMIVATSDLRLLVSPITMEMRRTYSKVLLFDLVFGHCESLFRVKG
jgi:hypothetical protein